MAKTRPVVVVAVVLYLVVGGALCYGLLHPASDDGGPGVGDPLAAGVFGIVYLAGAALLVRSVRAGTTWRTLLFPVGLLPVFAVVVILVLGLTGGFS